MGSNILEIEEHFRDGVVVKRLFNGIEQPLDKFPDVLRLQEFNSVHINQTMTVKEAKEIYGDFYGSIGTNVKHE